MKNCRPVGPINRRPPGSANAASRPIAKEPEMLTSKVPHGNVSPNWRPTTPENQKRPTLPSAPPIAIHKYASMEDRVQGCELRAPSQLQSGSKLRLTRAQPSLSCAPHLKRQVHSEIRNSRMATN